MTKIFSLEFLVAVLFIIDLFLFFLVFLIVKRVNRPARPDNETARTEVSGAGIQESAFDSAAEVLALLEPLVKESNEAAVAFEDLIREKKKITKDLNEALDSRIISINLLLSRAANMQRQMEADQHRLRQSMTAMPAPRPAVREPDIIDQQNQILDLYARHMDVDTIAEQLSIPKGEVQLVVDLKEKFMAMGQGR